LTLVWLFCFDFRFLAATLDLEKLFEFGELCLSLQLAVGFELVLVWLTLDLAQDKWMQDSRPPVGSFLAAQLALSLALFKSSPPPTQVQINKDISNPPPRSHLHGHQNDILSKLW
jgi:hypothetical protein